MGGETFYKWGDLLVLITDSHGHNCDNHQLTMQHFCGCTGCCDFILLLATHSLTHGVCMVHINMNGMKG